VLVGGHTQAWLITGYDEAKELLRADALIRDYSAPEAAQADPTIMDFLFLKEPPKHTRLRRIVNGAFSARRLNCLKVQAQEVATELIDEMRVTGPPADLQKVLAFPLPIAIISELLGIPEVDRDRFARWSTMVLRPLGQEAQDAAAAFGDLATFIRELVDAKPNGDDLLSNLARDTSPERLSNPELQAMAMGLLMAGYVTTSMAITSGVMLALRTPNVFDDLRSRRLPIVAFVEELLRCQDEEQGLQRFARTDFEFRGVTVSRGDSVIVSRTAANRDPSVFDRPDQFNPYRPNAASHITFGLGRHHCLGAALARIELEAAFQRLADELPGLKLAVDEGAVPWESAGLDVSISELPVVW
jgi:cytochrome P450